MLRFLAAGIDARPAHKLLEMVSKVARQELPAEILYRFLIV
jgi:phosphotransferase system HPr-like phosphotransfer protein